MSDLRSLPHFVARGDLPEIDRRTPVRQVYAHLQSAARSGFILEADGAPHAYVRARDLAEALFPRGAAADPEEGARLTDRPIGEVLDEHPGFTLPIEPDPVTPGVDLRPLQDRNDAVFAVVPPITRSSADWAEGRGWDSAEEEVDAVTLEGWLLNHETLLATSTRKTLWECKLGHLNADPDHGRCYRCPNPTWPVDG